MAQEVRHAGLTTASGRSVHPCPYCGSALWRRSEKECWYTHDHCRICGIKSNGWRPGDFVRGVEQHARARETTDIRARAWGIWSGSRELANAWTPGDGGSAWLPMNAVLPFDAASYRDWLETGWIVGSETPEERRAAARANMARDLRRVSAAMLRRA